MSLEEQLLTAIRAGDDKKCLALLKGKSEKERTALAGKILAAFDAAHAMIFSMSPAKGEKKLGVSPESSKARYAIWEAAKSALLRTLTNVGSIKKYVWRSIPESDDVVIEALRDRPRGFVLEWATQLCEHTPSRWWVVRRLVKEGLCDRPETDGYVLGLVHTAPARLSNWAGKKEKPLFDEDPALLDEEVWRIFEVEGNREVSLTSSERYWQKELLAWQASGRLDRARMLDATLGALARDFAQHKAGFYSRLHDALKPTPQEIAKRAGVYVELLGSRIAPTVSLATRVVESLPSDLALDTASFARAAISAARAARGQSTALALLRLLGAKRDDADALDAVAAFLEHGAADVIDAAMAILEGSKPSEALVARVASLAASIPASRRARVQAWLEGRAGGASAPAVKGSASGKGSRSTKDSPSLKGSASGKGSPSAKTSPAAKGSRTGVTVAASASSPDAKRAGVAALAKASPHGPWPRVTLDDRASPAPRLDPSKAVTPIADVDELLAAASRALEEPNDRVTYERVLDGVARLGSPLAALPKDATKPLLKRATKLDERQGHPATYLVRHWLAGEDGTAPVASDHGQEYVNTRRFGFRRVKGVLAQLARGKTRPLLAMPATEGFFVDPLALAAKVKAYDGALDVADAVTALLRLAPERRKAALKTLKGVKGELAAAVRHALGSDEDVPTKKSLAPLWFAAARARGGDDPAVTKAFPKAGADAGEAATITFRWKKTISKTSKDSSWGTLEVVFAPAPPTLAEVPPDAFAVLLATDGTAGHGAQFGVEHDVRAIASTFPSDRRTFFAHGAELIAGNVDFGSSAWENHVFIEALLDPDVPLDEPGLCLLAIATNTKEARENALATDALVAAIADGRVVGPELGTVMATFWDPIHDDVRWSRRPTAARWAKTFGTVAQTSVLHAEIVRRTLEAFFAAKPAAPPADLNVLLQLWLDLAVEAGIGVHGAARELLATYTGKAKKVANELLALEGRASAHAEEAHALALEGRVARAARWEGWGR